MSEKELSYKSKRSKRLIPVRIEKITNTKRLPKSAAMVEVMKSIMPKYKIIASCADPSYGWYRLVNIWYIRVVGDDPSFIVKEMEKRSIKEGSAMEEGRIIKGMRQFSCIVTAGVMGELKGAISALCKQNQVYDMHDYYNFVQYSASGPTNLFP